ncbi:MAG: hypothetical protein AAF938_23280 [Myxococcota bacterium]
MGRRRCNRLRQALVLALLSLCGCSAGETTLAAQFATGVGRDATHVELSLVPSCTSVNVTDSPSSALLQLVVVRPETEAAILRQDVPAGTYGLLGRAWDGQCRIVAAGCAEVVLDGTGGTRVVLLRAAEGRACDAGECERGACAMCVDDDCGEDAAVDASLPSDIRTDFPTLDLSAPRDASDSADAAPDAEDAVLTDEGVPDSAALDWQCPPVEDYVRWIPSATGTVEGDGLVRFAERGGAGCRFDAGAISEERVPAGEGGEVIFQLADASDHYFVGLSRDGAPSGSPEAMYVRAKVERIVPEGPDDPLDGGFDSTLTLENSRGDLQRLSVRNGECVRFEVGVDEIRVEVGTSSESTRSFSLRTPLPDAPLHAEMLVYGDCATPEPAASRAWMIRAPR